MQRTLSDSDSRGAGPGRNPDWSRDETILLMDLYWSAPRASQTHPEVVALSMLLRAAGQREGVASRPSFRNPAGISMRLRNFGRLDPNAPDDRDSGLRPGGAIDRQVWREFGGDPGKLDAEVARIRRAMAARIRRDAPRSSRGPVPAFGSRTAETEDGETGVYLVLIEGPSVLLIPGLTPNHERSLVKVGRTSDLDHRLAQLSSGLPACSSVLYVPVAFRMLRSAADAHRLERQLLDLCDELGWSLGGEFAYAPLGELKAALSGQDVDRGTAS